MKGFNHIVILLLLPFWGCKDTGSNPPIPLPQGMATIIDSAVTYTPTTGYRKRTAFSFSRLVVLPFNGDLPPLDRSKLYIGNRTEVLAPIGDPISV